MGASSCPVVPTRHSNIVDDQQVRGEAVSAAIGVVGAEQIEVVVSKLHHT